MGAGAATALPVGHRHVLDGSSWRAPRGAQVGAGTATAVPVGQRTCVVASAGGHLEVLQWAISVLVLTPGAP